MPSYKKKECPDCNGSGEVAVPCSECKGHPDELIYTCSTCGGMGYEVLRCGECGGSGEIDDYS